MSSSDQLRERSQQAIKNAGMTKSLRDAANMKKVAGALSDLADNQDWLDGKVVARDPARETGR